MLGFVDRISSGSERSKPKQEEDISMVAKSEAQSDGPHEEGEDEMSELDKLMDSQYQQESIEEEMDEPILSEGNEAISGSVG